jgi:glycosyltransferase involved in cell wall biosynthesis
MNIDIVTVAHNEEKMIKYFVEHYLPIARKIYILNHESTDKTQTIAESYGDQIEVISVNFAFSCTELSKVKSDFSKTLDADFVIVSDTDELIFPRNCVDILYTCKTEGITVPRTAGYHMLSDSFDFESDIYQIKKAFKDSHFDKKIVISPKVDISWTPGQHYIERHNDKYVESTDILLQLRHYKYINNSYVFERNQVVGTRLDKEDVAKGWGTHHLSSVSQQLQYINDMNSNSINLE